MLTALFSSRSITRPPFSQRYVRTHSGPTFFQRTPLGDAGEMGVAAGFFFALVWLGGDFMDLLVIPAVALETADAVEASLVVHPCCQRLDTQVKGDDAVITHRACLLFFGP